MLDAVLVHRSSRRPSPRTRALTTSRGLLTLAVIALLVITAAVLLCVGPSSGSWAPAGPRSSWPSGAVSR
ncbi:hypothetical protein QJS66_14265 [Kocuria rhizophila]|nr:hypothetical protein QJS66_14265 [Kocuria rhizophila]